MCKSRSERKPVFAHLPRLGAGRSRSEFLEPSSAGSRSVAVPAAWRRDREAQASLEHRYYLPSDAWRLSLFGRGDGLVQPLRTQLGTFQYDGDRVLHSGAGRRVSLRPTRNLELRSGFAVHLGRFPGSTQKSVASRSAAGSSCFAGDLATGAFQSSFSGPPREAMRLLEHFRVKFKSLLNPEMDPGEVGVRGRAICSIPSPGTIRATVIDGMVGYSYQMRFEGCALSNRRSNT